MEASATGKRPLDGQVALVSGGLGDIGRATARALHEAGARVAISDLPPVKVARALSPEFHYTRVDVCDAAEMRAWLDRVERDVGTPSLVVCNAGLVVPMGALDTTEAVWERTLAVNLTGAFLLAQLAARRMVRRRLQGRIVLVGSWAGHVPHAQITAYSVAKAGLRMAMKCLAVELAPAGILVNEIAPGIVDAGLSGKLMARRRGLREKTRRKIPVQRLLEAGDVARGVVSLCQPENRHMTGSVLLMDGGLSLKGPI
ncbi:MAG: SDR family oxidoreductase [Opitutaceae bacterium]